MRVSALVTVFAEQDQIGQACDTAAGQRDDVVNVIAFLAAERTVHAILADATVTDMHVFDK